jgi:hypothetical protein
VITESFGENFGAIDGARGNTWNISPKLLLELDYNWLRLDTNL